MNTKIILIATLLILLSACGPTQEEREVIDKKWNNYPELSQEESIMLATKCGQAGLVPKYDYQYRPQYASEHGPYKKLQSVRCVAPRGATDGLTDAAALGAAAYIGGKLLESATK